MSFKKKVMYGGLIIFCCLQFDVMSQKILMSHEDIQGAYTGHCIIETVSQTTISFCDLCPISLDKDSTRIRFDDLDLEIDQNQLRFSANGKEESTEYKYNAESTTLVFMQEGEEQNYKLLGVSGTTNTTFILEDNEGDQILLVKKE